MKRLYLVFLVTILLSLTSTIQAQEWPPQSIEEMPFIGGKFRLPELVTNQNLGILNSIVPGMTDVQFALSWRFLEVGQEEWDAVSIAEIQFLHDQCQAMNPPKDLEPYPWSAFAPPWFKANPSLYTPLTEYLPSDPQNDTVKLDMLSPWAPATLEYLGRFWEGMKENIGDLIGHHIAIGLPSSEYSEVGFVMGNKAHFCEGGILYPFFPLEEEALHKGLWCNDPYAKQHFKDWAWDKYDASIGNINTAWGQSWNNKADIVFPVDQSQRRYWIDFMRWYAKGMTDFTANLVAKVREQFPNKVLNIKMGFADEDPLMGLDRTAITKLMADYKPFTVNAMHCSFRFHNTNFNPPLIENGAYYFYKRVAPLCHNLGLGVGNESTGGNLNALDLKREFFEATSVGLNYIFQYNQNMNVFNNDPPSTVNRYKEVLRPWTRSLVDVAVLYPICQLYLDMTRYPDWKNGYSQLSFCDMNRDNFDYDIVDENMLEWDMLDDYSVLINTSGEIFEQVSLDKIDAWIRNGGLLINRADFIPENVEGANYTSSAWFNQPTKPAGGFSFHQVGDGAVVNILLEDTVDAIKAAPQVIPSLKIIHGFDGQEDSFQMTEFPREFMVLDLTDPENDLPNFFIKRDLDFDQVMLDAGFDPAAENRNGNGVLDSDEFALLSQVMSDEELYQSHGVWKAFAHNFLQIYKDAPALTEALRTVLTAYMTLGDNNSVNFVKNNYIPGLLEGLYERKASILADWGDVDNDSITNGVEYAYSGSNRDRYLVQAIAPDYYALFVNFSLSFDLDMNNNQIPDLHELSVITEILADPVAWQHSKIKEAYNHNWDRFQMDSGTGMWLNTLFSSYITLGDDASFLVIFQFYPSLIVDPDDYIRPQDLLAYDADLDWDSLTNLDEYLASSDLLDYLERVLVPSYDAAFTRLGLPLTGDYNGVPALTPNWITDLDEFALISKLLAEELWQCASFVKPAWNFNMAQMIEDTAEASFLANRKQHILTAVGYMTLGDPGSTQLAVDYIWSRTSQSVALDPSDYDLTACDCIAFNGNADGDTYLNLEEYVEANGVRDLYLQYVLNPNQP